MKEKDTIKFLEYRDGRVTREGAEMEKIARGFFEELFVIKRVDKLNHILSRLDRCIFDDLNAMLIAKYIEEEVFVALRDIGPTKAPGIDDFWMLFFKDIGVFWEGM